MWAAYARHWKLLIPLALVVLLPQALADAIAGDFEVHDVRTLGDVLRLVSVPLTIAINLGGEALYAGILATVVVGWRSGTAPPGIREVVRRIPYGRLIAIDLILALGTAFGLILLVIPGVLVYTYLVISPALVEIQQVTIREALRRSIELVQGNFWRVLGISLLFIFGTDAIGTALEAPHGLATGTAFNLAVEAALEPFQGLATVLIALALIDIHRGENDA